MVGGSLHHIRFMLRERSHMLRVWGVWVQLASYAVHDLHVWRESPGSTGCGYRRLDTIQSIPALSPSPT